MRGKKTNSRAKIPQKLFRITPVSLYKREKEDREFLIGLVLFFILKITFFFNELKKAVWRCTLVWKLNLWFWTSGTFEVFTKTHVSASLWGPSHAQKPSQFYLGRCGTEPTAGHSPEWWKWEKFEGFFLLLGNKSVHSNLGLKLNCIPSSQHVASTPPGMHKNALACI